MPSDTEKAVREAVLSAMEASLEAQLRAIRRLRLDPQPARGHRIRGRMSQVAMAEDVLRRAGVPLHINEIIERIKKLHHVEVDAESLVSALSKRVQRSDRFVREGPNEFSLGPGARRP
jgi:hypothetical protein